MIIPQMNAQSVGPPDHDKVTNRTGLRKCLSYSFCLLLFSATVRPPATDGEETPAPTEDACRDLAGDMQICWGRKNLERDQRAQHTAAFSFKFAIDFGSVPVVSQAINVNGSGHAMAVYSWKLDTKEYSGRLNNMYI